jgi:hypothetical protein
VPFRVNTVDVGNRILALIADLEKNQSMSPQLPDQLGSGTLFVRRYSR